ncbi:MAG: DUF4956 domain-containing protein [Verrucomicrobiales bacterium]|jgi:hypothetical protein
MRFIFSQLALLFCCCAFASAAPEEAPEIIAKSFSEKYPDIESPKWEAESGGSWEARFEARGIKFRADFDAEGNWVETEHNTTFEELPSEVRSAIVLKYNANDIQGIEGVDSHTHGIFYDVEFQRGAKKQDIMFDSRGKVLDPVRPPTEKGFFQHWVNQTKRDTKLSKTGWALVYKTLFNILTIFIYAYVIYYRRHHDHKMLFLLLAFNLFLFPIFLSSSLVTAGFGFTIFALLALVRLRSEAFDKAEIAYLLGAISLTFVNTMLPTYVDIPSAILILLTAYLADKPSVWRDNFQKIEVDYRISEKEKMLDHDYLRKQLSDEYAIEVREITINRVFKNEVRLTLMYRDISASRRAEIVTIKEQERQGAALIKQQLEEAKQKKL